VQLFLLAAILYRSELVSGYLRALAVQDHGIDATAAPRIGVLLRNGVAAVVRVSLHLELAGATAL